MTRRPKQLTARAVRSAALPPEPPPGMRRVTVQTKNDNFRSVDAWLYGEWAAHEAISVPGWTVTYLPCGRNLNKKQLDEVEARRLADWLDYHITRDELLDWGAPSAEVVARIYQGIEMATTSVEEMAS